MSYFRCRRKKGYMTLVECLFKKTKVVFPDTCKDENITIIDNKAIISSYVNLLVDEIQLPKNLEIIGSYAFNGFYSLKEIELPNTLKEIKHSAFAKCNSLEEITFPKSMEKVGAYAFSDCKSLKRIIIKNPVTKISSTAFRDCTSLEYVSFELLKFLPIDIQCNLMILLLNDFSQLSQEEQGEIVSYLKKKSSLRKAIFLSGDTIPICFLIELKTKITLDMLDEFIAKSVKVNNTEITAIFLDYKNNNFKKEVIDEYNTNKELVGIGLELPTLKQFKAKWKCSRVEGGLAVSEYIGYETHETIPSELADGTKIVELRKLKLGKGITIPTGSLTHLTIDAPITYLTENAFRYSKLESVILPDTLESVGGFVFDHCFELSNIVLSSNLKILPRNMFGFCNSIKEVNLPVNLEEIKDFAFLKCEQLKIVNFPKHQILTKNRPFVNCKNLANEDGFLIFQGVLYQYFGLDDVVIIPDYVYKISINAFKSYKFKEIVIPKLVNIIETHTFSFNAQLEKVTFSDNIQEIEKYAFAATPLLQKVTLPHGVILGECAFDKSVEIILV